MRVSTTRRRRGGAKVNLLIGVIVVGLVAAFVVPIVQKQREAAARTQSINNLKQIALAMSGFHDANKTLPFNGSDLPDGTWNFKAEAVLDDSSRTGSWGFQIMP